MGRSKKTNFDFLTESIDKSIERGHDLMKIRPDCYDSYDQHSLLKLICFNYWTAIFCPIIGKNVPAPMIYIDSMAGSGITRTKSGTMLCGSAPSALLTSFDKKYPFNAIHAVEIDAHRADALRERLTAINQDVKIKVYNEDIRNVSEEIVRDVKGGFCLVLIDPQGFEGFEWEKIKPLICLPGDVIINFFESDLFRMVGQCLSPENPICATKTSARIDDILGTHDWIKVKDPEELTEIFADRIRRESGKNYHQTVKIMRKSSGNNYKIILFTSDKVKNQADKWKENLDRRLSGIDYDMLSTLFEIKEGKITSLDKFLP